MFLRGGVETNLEEEQRKKIATDTRPSFFLKMLFQLAASFVQASKVILCRDLFQRLPIGIGRCLFSQQ
jgi:hypothetical protein